MASSKLKTALLGFVLSGLFAAQGFAAGFEGEMQFVMKSGKKEYPVTYFVKGQKVRVEPKVKAADSPIMITDYKRKKTYMLNQKEVYYIEMDLPEAKESEKPKEKDKLDFSKTGKTKTILGYHCEEWVAKGKKGVTEMWLAKGLGNFAGLGGNVGSKHAEVSGWEKEVADKGMFPLMMVQKDDEGKEKSRWEVKKLEKKSLDDSKFTVPSTYFKRDLPKGPMGGMKDMFKGMKSN